MESTSPGLQFVEYGGIRIGCRYRPGRSPTIIFLPGYMSDMEGAKAQALDAFAAARGLSCLRLDYSGTGSSQGTFEDGTLDRWLGECLAAIDQLTDGPLILAGSSMGGWLAMHIALQLPERVGAIVGIAAAPDFTNWGFSDGDREQLRTGGRIEEREADGSSGRFFTRPFWESGQKLLILGDAIDVTCPVRLVHGEVDADVPLELAHRLMRQLRSADVQLTIVKGGGHRLSAPHEIDAILCAAAGLLEPVR